MTIEDQNLVNFTSIGLYYIFLLLHESGPKRTVHLSSTVSGQSAKVKVPETKKWTAKNCQIKLDGSKGQKTIHFYPDSREPPITIKLED